MESLEQVNYSYIYSIHYCTISSYLLQHGKVIIPPHLVMKERRLRLNSEVLQNSTCGRVATMEVLQALEHKARWTPWGFGKTSGMQFQNKGWNNNQEPCQWPNHSAVTFGKRQKFGYTLVTLDHAWGFRDMLSPPQRSLAHPNDPGELKHGFDRQSLPWPTNGPRPNVKKIHNKYMCNNYVPYFLVLFDMFMHTCHTWKSSLKYPETWASMLANCKVSPFLDGMTISDLNKECGLWPTNDIYDLPERWTHGTTGWTCSTGSTGLGLKRDWRQQHHHRWINGQWLPMAWLEVGSLLL